MFGAEVSNGVAEVVQASGWFLENAWVIPVIPAIAFFLIIFFGKKLPMKGSELGILSMLATLFFSAMAVWQWIDAVNSAPKVLKCCQWSRHGHGGQLVVLISPSVNTLMASRSPS
jgi:NADH:ubiquinone oxidoreductase subunit 5 (subunit L)/multisubunit Na+/H+ antiporter MnhA subunit